ncbi:AAA family ATPase [Sphaerisporangium dianthi]|uniref:AAA family ATPase n=1 Tax=Sphaerisporangium dianthi TaxID=1436120 RepID=A0ABV9CUU4_9ACTN
MALVERDTELGRLSDLLGACALGAGAIAIVRGPVAVGKTELLHTFARDVAAPRARYLGATGSPAERDLPFGLLSQLFHDAVGEHAEQAAAVPPAGGAFTGRADPQVLDGVWRFVRAMAAGRPLVIGVDDVDHADDASLQCLLFIARRVRQAPVMLVLGERVGIGPGSSVFRAELLRQPHCVQIRLERLSCDGVAALLARDLDPRVAHGLAAPAFEATGGNPLLVQALAEDWQAAARSGGFRQPAGLVIGDRFAEAVMSCLYRCEHNALAVARAVAVLGEPHGSAIVAQLAGLHPVETGATTGLLEEAGVLRQGRYRHPVAREAVLRELPSGQRAELHAGAARLLHAEGAPPTSVAWHLVAAGRAAEPWTASVLQESANNATASGEFDFALDCLKLAHHMADADEQQHVAGQAVLARTEWKADPARVVRHLDRLTDALHQGRLAGEQVAAAFEYLLWHGRGVEAAQALGRLSGAPRLAEVRACLESCYPAQRGAAGRATPVPRSTSSVTTMLRAAAGRFTSEEEYLSQGFELDGTPLAPLAAALLALARPARLDKLAPWCPTLLEEAAGRGTRIWRGLLTAVRADRSLLRGDLPGAVKLAAEALTELSTTGWGVVIGAPLACALLAMVEMGRDDEAAAWLSTPVPGALLETPFGLRYLQARGQYQLACGRPYAALSDFQACGRLLSAWEADDPDAMPWRIDAAQALLRLGRRAEARKLLSEQIARLDETRDRRTLGRALRHLAATADTLDRPKLLAESVQMLRMAGDQLEYAHALADLGRAHSAAGDSRRARVTLRRAWRVAKDCQAEGLAGSLLPSLAATPSARTRLLPNADGTAELSAAEYRVGVLAARNYTNRQIANHLCITVSTVEQHLTRVYRKLKVRSRADLPVYLQIEEGEPTGTDP